jgi:hypothetical protein
MIWILLAHWSLSSEGLSLPVPYPNRALCESAARITVAHNLRRFPGSRTVVVCIPKRTI